MGEARNQQTKYERRVTLALKWFYLDHCTCEEIQDRLLEAGYKNTASDDGKFAISTIRDYINSEPAEEVREKVREKHAHTRIQVAERQEQLYARAREAEMEATDSDEIIGMRPVMDKVDGRLANPKTIRYSWELVDPEDPDWPEWAEPGIDKIIRFTEGRENVEPGNKYPKRGPLGEPEYEKYCAGIKRGEPDLTQRSFLRQEQSQHLEQKGKAMGIYEETLNIQGDLGLEAEVTVPDELVQAVVGASRDGLSSDGGDSSED